MVNEVVSVSSLGPLGEGREELIGTSMEEAGSHNAHHVGPAVVGMMHCLDAEI
ncbi:MAG: hypothetical protein QOI48_2933 [Solirubrobacteraceae bacterium]|jgi:hypothetical protein|nr:hypothetical protein [Solirubrobacteraceae bacterium]